jgi:hypothetical protein
MESQERNGFFNYLILSSVILFVFTLYTTFLHFTEDELVAIDTKHLQFELKLYPDLLTKQDKQMTYMPFLDIKSIWDNTRLYTVIPISLQFHANGIGAIVCFVVTIVFSFANKLFYNYVYNGKTNTTNIPIIMSFINFAMVITECFLFGYAVSYLLYQYMILSKMVFPHYYDLSNGGDVNTQKMFAVDINSKKFISELNSMIADPIIIADLETFGVIGSENQFMFKHGYASYIYGLAYGEMQTFIIAAGVFMVSITVLFNLPSFMINACYKFINKILCCGKATVYDVDTKPDKKRKSNKDGSLNYGGGP